MKKNDLRIVACGIAKDLAKAAGPGRKPNEFMSEAWALVRAGQTQPRELKFWNVEYKMVKIGVQKAIVGASNKEAAAKQFNDTDDEFGPRAEIRKVTEAKKIPSNMLITVNNSEGIPVSGNIPMDIVLDGQDRNFELYIKGKKHNFKLSNIVSVTKQPKEAVINAGRN